MQDTAEQRLLLRLASLPSDGIQKLAEAIYNVPVMRSPNSRQNVLEWVQKRNHSFNPSRSDRDREEVTNFVRACQADDESFDLLCAAIRLYTADDAPERHDLKQLVNSVLPRSLLTKSEFRELLTLNLDAAIGSGQLAVGMRKALAGEIETGGDGFTPANVREAMLLLLDAPSPENGMQRLLRFLDWLGRSASYLCDDPVVAEQLDELAGRIGHSHDLPVTVREMPAQARLPDVSRTRGKIGIPQGPAEDVGAIGQVTDHFSGEREAPAEFGQPARGVPRLATGGEPRYLVGDKDTALKTRSPYERSLLDLADALRHILPGIFRDPRIRSRELNMASKALASISPLIEALDTAAREEARQPARGDLQQLDDLLRKQRKAVSEDLAALDRVRTERAARKLCDNLAAKADSLLDAGIQAIRHMT